MATTYMGPRPPPVPPARGSSRRGGERGCWRNVPGEGRPAAGAPFESRFGNHHHVGDIRGRGLFLGIELVADRGSKQAFDPGLKLHAKVKKEAMGRGLMCYPMGGTIDGRRGDHILLAPPFIIDEAHVAEIVEKLGDAVDAALAN